LISLALDRELPIHGRKLKSRDLKLFEIEIQLKFQATKHPADAS